MSSQGINGVSVWIATGRKSPNLDSFAKRLTKYLSSRTVRVRSTSVPAYRWTIVRYTPIL